MLVDKDTFDESVRLHDRWTLKRVVNEKASGTEGGDYKEPVSASLRFGDLNLIVTTATSP